MKISKNRGMTDAKVITLIVSCAAVALTIAVSLVFYMTRADAAATDITSAADTRTQPEPELTQAKINAARPPMRGGISVSRTAIQSSFEKIDFTFREGKSSSPENCNVQGTSKQGLTLITLNGPPDDLREASCTVAISNDMSKEDLLACSMHITQFLTKIVPDWKLVSDWCIAAIKENSHRKEMKRNGLNIACLRAGPLIIFSITKDE